MRAPIFYIAGFAAISCSHAPAPAPASGAPSAASDPIASFETIRAVLQSPRCVNCHPNGDQPTQGDDRHIHQQSVQRGPSGRGAVGLACSTCHGKANPPDSYGAHMPPGVSTEWRLPPPEHRMVFAGRSSRELCLQLKDRRQNGGLDMAGLTHHMADDALTRWGWSPGYGRKPVPVSHDEFVRAFKAWASAGAPCPAERVARDR